MAYFSNAFRQIHLGTKKIITVAGDPTMNLHDVALGNGVGTFGFYNKDTYLSVNTAGVTNQSLILASSSLILNDSRGEFHGGYAESSKSKYINPKLINRFYHVAPNTPTQQIAHFGNTNHQTGCAAEFVCEETYTLNLEAIGAAALRFANRELYRRFDAYTGCCVEGAASPLVDSTLVFLEWAKQIVADPYFKDFTQVVVYTELGNPLFATEALALAAGFLVTDTYDLYASPGHTPNTLAGMRFEGSYIDTQFGICSYSPKDYINKEPVRIEAQLVDVDGEACSQDICFVVECEGLQAMGIGDSVLNDVILSESYLQNTVSSDPRLREITGGNDILNAVNRAVFYDRYFILHSVPRFNNATSIYDNDQYLLDIIVDSTAGTIGADLEAFMAAWLLAAGSNVVLEETGHDPANSCTPDAL
jgi:hypothetical protein